MINDPLLLVDSNDNLIVVWQGQGAASLELYYATYDHDDASWSPPSAITDNADAEWAYQPFINASGELEVIYLQRAIVPASNDGSSGEGEDPPPTPPLFSTSSLNHVAVKLGPDLAVTHIQHSDSAPLPGETIQVTATVQNIGDLATIPVSIAFSESGNPFAVESIPGLPAGGSIDITIDWLVPNTTVPQTLLAQADTTNLLVEIDEDNNDTSHIIAIAAASTITIPSAGTLTLSADTLHLVAQLDGTNVFRAAGDSVEHLHIVAGAFGARFGYGSRKSVPTNLTVAHEMNRSVSLRKPTAEIRTDQPSRLVCTCCVVRQSINVTARIRVQLKTALLSIRFALREEEGESGLPEAEFRPFGLQVTSTRRPSCCGGALRCRRVLSASRPRLGPGIGLRRRRWTGGKISRHTIQGL